MFNTIKSFFVGKSYEEKEKELLALGKYVWVNRQMKIQALETELSELKKANEILKKKIEVSQLSLKQEIAFSAKMLNERRLNDVKRTQRDDNKPGI
jgi:hypothetical protein